MGRAGRAAEVRQPKTTTECEMCGTRYEATAPACPECKRPNPAAAAKAPASHQATGTGRGKTEGKSEEKTGKGSSSSSKPAPPRRYAGIGCRRFSDE